MADFEESTRRLIESTRQRFPDWDSSRWQDWEPSADTPAAIPFGHVELDMSQMDGGPSADDRPSDKRLAGRSRARFELPALVPFPDRSLIFNSRRSGSHGGGPCAGRGDAADAECVAGRARYASRSSTRWAWARIFRLSCTWPTTTSGWFPAAFGPRAATSTSGLVDLTEHMENVIQVYLRNEFKTILEYNEFAGEMAEPYRILVVANFPANFTESAARRLTSIISSGARCGVHTLMTVDTRRENAARLPARRPRPARPSPGLA